jgi:pimeloyl-ACP methyl ester carboxylesterase
MYLTVNNHSSYCYTAGKALDATKPTVVFIHGVVNDHSVWVLQSRYLANHGYNVLAVDLPGHCKSQGEAPATVEEAAGFIAALLDAAGLQRVALVGHSWGSLIALQAAAKLKQRITHLVLVGTAYPMKVSQALLDASLNEPMKALTMINVFSRSTLAAPPSSLGPGTWVYGASMALGRRVLASNAQVNVFHRGFKACDSYTNGEQAMAEVTCPVLFILGDQDQMTQAKAAQLLVGTARSHGKQVQVTHLPVGHHQMTELPDATLHALQKFLSTPG